MEFLSQANAGYLYLIVGIVLAFVTAICIISLVKSYRAGIMIGMDKKVLKKAITSSAMFTVLPSISILIGVIALSGSLGVPFSWLRLSVIGALQYELNVAEVAATSIGLTGLKVSEMSIGALVSIAFVMTICILSGVVCCIIFLKKYLKKIKKKPKTEQTVKKGYGAYATIAMFIGLCSAFIGSYVGKLTSKGDYMPLAVACVSALAMAVFEYLIAKKKITWIENFSVATSMIIGMITAVFLGMAG